MHFLYDIIPNLLVVIGGLLIVIVGAMAMVKYFYVKVPQGTALIVNNLAATPRISFTGALVLPVIHKKEFMRISLLSLTVDRRGKEGLICRDNLRADITVAFYLKVNKSEVDVLNVAQNIGVDRASDIEVVNELLNAKLSEALKTVGKQFELHKLFEERQNFRDRIVDVIGKDLNGYTLEDVAIDYLEQTPKSQLDPDNIFDSEGIRKITEITAAHNVVTNEAERNQELAIQKKNVETKEASLALERQQADAEARQKREVETLRARESAETLKVQEEERLKAEQARIQTQQEIEVREENRLREVEVAQQNRSRAVSIEIEKVQRAKDLEIVAREREVELMRIEKEKALEEERKIIASVIRERVAVEKTVAQEEERIKEVREVSQADRAKQVAVIDAEAVAETNLVGQVKQAEADKESATYKAMEVTTMAQADLEAAAKQADAKKRLAEGTEAEAAALGLAEAQVRQAKAAALEKEGAAEAAVITHRVLAEAKGIEEKGLAEAKALEGKRLAEARAREAHAAAIEREGTAEAAVIAQKMQAEARGVEARAVAREKEGTAEAEVVTRKLMAEAKGEEQLGLAKGVSAKALGLAEAEVTLQKLKAEAEGLADKFSVMGNLNEVAKEHEEFRISIEKHLEEALAHIAANKDIAREQAEVLAAGLAKSNIDIVGGDTSYFESFAKMLTVGKSISGLMDRSQEAKEFIEAATGRLRGQSVQNGLAGLAALGKQLQKKSGDSDTKDDA